MTLNNRIAAYGDCISFFEAAVADRVGARARFEDRSEAHYFSMRMHKARVLLRAETRLQYPAQDPRYDRCEFDCLIVKIKFAEDGYWVYAERANMDLKVEPLTQGPRPASGEG